MRRITRIDKSGEPFDIAFCDAEGLSSLIEMYRTFLPKPASQGLPPTNSEVCFKWVNKLFEIGTNFLAWRNDRVIGHAALVPDLDGKSGEFVIFVDQDFRNLGIGSQLIGFTIDEATDLAYHSIWLTVENSNLVAIKLYRNFGFQFCDDDICERIMLLKLEK